MFLGKKNNCNVRVRTKLNDFPLLASYFFNNNNNDLAGSNNIKISGKNVFSFQYILYATLVEVIILIN